MSIEPGRTLDTWTPSGTSCATATRVRCESGRPPPQQDYLHAKGVAPRLEGKLGGGVRGVAREGVGAGDARDVDYTRPARADEQREEMLRHEERAKVDDLHHASEADQLVEPEEVAGVNET